MQTFLPYSNFEKTAKVLDYRRLGKQRVETYQILKTLANESNGWSNHPIVNMWRGHEHSLIEYGVAMCNEWISRDYVDNLKPKIIEYKKKFKKSKPPEWLKNRHLIHSHRSNLLRKDKEYYSKFWKDIPSDLEYIWIK